MSIITFRVIDNCIIDEETQPKDGFIVIVLDEGEEIDRGEFDHSHTVEEAIELLRCGY